MICYYCEYPLLPDEITTDHFLPICLFEEHKHSKENKVTCCWICNSEKRSLTGAEYLKLLKSLKDGCSEYLLIRNNAKIIDYIKFLILRNKHNSSPKNKKRKWSKMYFYSHSELMFTLNNSRIIKDALKYKKNLSINYYII